MHLRVCMNGETGMCVSGVTVCVWRESWGVFLGGGLGMFVWRERWVCVCVGVCVYVCRQKHRRCMERERGVCGCVSRDREISVFGVIGVW